MISNNKRPTSWDCFQVFVKVVYFVVNKYWERFTEIIDIAQETADKWAIINGGQVYVFKYSF